MDRRGRRCRGEPVGPCPAGKTRSRTHGTLKVKKKGAMRKPKIAVSRGTGPLARKNKSH